jgi:hypothetical protein
MAECSCNRSVGSGVVEVKEAFEWNIEPLYLLHTQFEELQSDDGGPTVWILALVTSR